MIVVSKFRTCIGYLNGLQFEANIDLKVSYN